MYVCVDFDGTIVDHEYPAIGLPVPNAITTLAEAQRCGAKLILFTMRDGPELRDAVEYLEDAGIQLFGVNENPDQIWSGSRKVYGHCYIDDAALGVPLIKPDGFARPCVDWNRIRPLLFKNLTRRK